MERKLIVNADDFGQTRSVNEGVVRAHDDGILTSASLMVRWPAAQDAVMLAADRPAMSVGLHVDLAEWTCRGDEWFPVYEFVDASDAAAVVREFEEQHRRFVELVGREPTHLDSHQHAHRSGPLREVLVGAARALGVPLRDDDPRVAYCGDFYGQTATGEPYRDAIEVEALVALISALPPGITELGCHPAIAGDDLESMYRDERTLELATLCDPRVRDVLEECDITLISFHDVR